METRYTVELLREKIKELEFRQADEGKIFKDQLKYTYESLKPANILKSVFNDLVSSETLKDDFINAAASYTSGLLTRNLIVGKSKNPLLKIAGLGIQFGITALVTKNYGSVKEVFSQYLSAFISKMHDSVANGIFDDENSRENNTTK